MGKKNLKGGKGRKKGKRFGDDKRELEFKDEGQEYAQVTKMLGNNRLEANCFDGTIRLCLIRGKFKKRVWINTGDIILLGLREYQDGKADVILKYNPDEARLLKAYGEIPEHVVIGSKEAGNGDEERAANGDIQFGEGSDGGSDSDSEKPQRRTTMRENPDSESDEEDEPKKKEEPKDWDAVLANM